jgi:osomolarity two-component system, sensor histidine kinase SLN1
LPTIGLFGLKLKRLPQLIGVLSYFVVGCVLILQWKATWYRNILQTMAFHFFLMWVHYMRENAERRLYILRDQLKLQYKATQKAQINERKAAESKRRLTSYVFHEVRVPLNTALLAVQNMAAIGVFARSQEIEFKALEGSLSMMSKVLNDVLDFNRMDSGRFESVSKPYAFHQVMRSLFVPLRMATDARKLQVRLSVTMTAGTVF